jgi:hypothetical protein
MPESSKTLTREAILSSQDLMTEPVEVPEWGGIVHVRALSAGESLALQDAVAQKSGLDPVVEFVAAVLVDEAGQRLFTADDIGTLKGKGFKALMRVFDAATKLNAFTQADTEELEKN